MILILIEVVVVVALTAIGIGLHSLGKEIKSARVLDETEPKS